MTKSYLSLTFVRLKLIYITYLKRLVQTPQRTQHVAVRKTKWAMLK